MGAARILRRLRDLLDVDATNIADGKVPVYRSASGKHEYETVSGGASTAADVSIVDAGGYYTGTDVEAALQEVAADVGSIPTDYVAKSLFDANTILKADSDNTPAALTMGASTILARLAAGSIVAATPAELRTLLELVVGTNVQAYDADLTTWAGLTPSAFFQTLVDDADAAAARTTLETMLRRPAAYISGQYYCGEIGPNGGGGSMTQSRCFFNPLVIDVTTSFDRIACYISTNGTASSVMRMGIYNDSGGVPSTVLLDAGTVAIDAGAAAIKAITISQQLTPGRYWLAGVVQAAASGNMARVAFPGGNLIPIGPTFQTASVSVDNVTGALGDNPSVVYSAATNGPVVALRVA